MLGTRVTGVAYPLLVLAMTHSPAKAGLVGFAQSLPFMLFYLPAGALVDRWNRKRVMLVAEAGRALALGSIAVTLASGSTTLAQIVVVAFVEGSFFVFFRLSESSALPRIVPREQLPTAIAQNQAREQGAELGGQPLGGLLFGLSRTLPFAFDAISYAVSFVSLLFIRPAFQEEREPRTTRLTADIKEGVAWLWNQQFLRASILLVTCTNFVFSAVYLALIVRAKDLGASPSLIGVMLAFGGVGALLGSIAAPAIQRRIHPKLVVMGSLWLWAVTAPVIAALPNAVAIGAIWGVTAIAGPVFNVSLASYRYALVPDRLLARVQSAALVVAWGAVPLGQLTAGLLLSSTGAVKTILSLAGLNAVAALLATWSRSIRNAPRVDELLATNA
ncbi:MAG: MFS transporter [Actinobacteria bacterium]|nr:MAG: MFS transporter [Actinomycetota bacterium]